MIRIWLLVLAVWCGVGAAPRLFGAVLCDYSGTAPATGWQVLEGGESVVLQIMENKLEFTTFSTAKTGVRWPSIQLRGADMPFCDWRSYDTLTFTVENPAAVELKLCMQFRLAGGGSGTGYFEVPPGVSCQSWALPEVIQSATVAELRIFRNDPAEDATFFIYDIKLTTLGGGVEKLAQTLENKLKYVIIGSAAEGEELELIKQQIVQAVKLSPENAMAELQKLTVNVQDFCAGNAASYNQALLAEVFPADGGKVWNYAVAGTDKIFRYAQLVPAKPLGRVDLYAAGRELENAQIVLYSKQNLANVQLKYTAGITPGMRPLPEAWLDFMVVGYVTPPPADYPVEQTADYWPDPLLDFLPEFTLDAEVWQPVWVEVAVPPDTPPGKYAGNITISATGAADLTVPITVEVWNFNLPQRQSLKNLFTYEANDAHKIYAESEAGFIEFQQFQRGEISWPKLSAEARRLREIELATENLLLKNRCSPSSLYLVERPAAAGDVKRWIDQGAACFNIFYVASQPHLQNGEAYPEWRTNQIMQALEQIIPEYQAAGVLEYACIYAFDEIGENQFFAAQEVLSKIKQKYPQIPVLTTAFDASFGMDSQLDGVIDWWCPTTKRYLEQAAAVAAGRNRGRNFWYYTCCDPAPPSLNLLLEQPAAAARLLTGVRAYEYGTQGFLYYQTTLWEPNTRITQGPVTEHNGKSAYFDFHGDGMLLYPGPNGPLSSMRLAAVRDGFEDYEYLKLLEHAAASDSLPSAWREQAQKLLDIQAFVPGNLTEYHRYENELQNYRRQIGEFLSKLPL